MSMESNAFLPALRQLPAVNDMTALSSEEIRARIVGMDRGQFAVDVSLGVEEALQALYDERNVPDVLQEAYSFAFSGKAEDGVSLLDNYRDARDRGDQAEDGFVSNLKGKVAELRTEELLEERMPGWDWEIAQNANQPVWDLVGRGPDGQEMLIQVKTGTEGYATAVVEAMQESPNVPFAVSTEIFDAISESNPELVGRLVDIGSNADLTENVEEGLGTLAGNLGVDVPDRLGDALPFVAEIVLGVRLIWQILRTERELSGVDLDYRARVHGVRTLTLMSRFGINQVLIWSGVSVGSSGGTLAMPGAGTVVGGVVGGAVGLGGGMALNRALQSRIEEVAIKLVGGDADYVFYLMNKAAVDGLAGSFATTNAA